MLNSVHQMLETLHTPLSSEYLAGATHAMDITVAAPVFDTGELIAFFGRIRT